MLALDIAEFLRTIATNCSEGLAWLLGILGTVGMGTIIGAIVAIIKSKIQSKNLINSVNTANKENYDYIMSLMKEFEEKINNSNDATKETVSTYGKDNAIISELLLMLASKLGFSNEEIVKIANKYKELPKADHDVATNLISQVEEENKQVEYERIQKKQEELKSKEDINTALESLKSTDTTNLSKDNKKSQNDLKIVL